MITMTTGLALKGISGNSVADFMLNCTDELYQKWWPGIHFAFHTLKRYPDNIGNTVVFDELVGKRRLKFTAVVTEVIPGKRMVWQMTKGITLPGWLVLEFEDTMDGVEIVHTLKVGYQGIGQILDPFMKLYLSDEFERALENHAQTEFSKLAEMLS